MYFFISWLFSVLILFITYIIIVIYHDSEVYVLGNCCKCDMIIIILVYLKQKQNKSISPPKMLNLKIKMAAAGQ